MLITLSQNPQPLHAFVEDGDDPRQQAVDKPSAEIAPLAEPPSVETHTATVQEIVDNYLTMYRRRDGHSADAAKNSEYTLYASVIKVWSSRIASTVTKGEAIELLEKIIVRNGTPGQARNVLKACRSAWSYAISKDLVSDNPFKEINLRHVLPEAIAKARKRVLRNEEIVKVWTGLCSPPGSESVRRACQLILLTAQRPGEVAAMHRSEIEGRWWTIPTERTKYKVGPYRVYLTDAALEIIGDRSGYIFPSPVKEGCCIARGSISGHVNRTSNSEEWSKLPHYGVPDWHPQDLRRTADLPVFHPIAIQLQVMLETEDFVIDDVVDLVNGDAALAGQILKMANSPMYVGRVPSETIKEAAIRLGASKVSNLAMAVSQSNMHVSSNKTINECLLSLWLHSHACALGCQWVANQTGHSGQADRAYMAGLLHDIGKLYLVKAVEKLNAANVALKAAEVEMLIELFREMHIDLGKRVMSHWNMPRVYCDLTARHDDATYEGKDPLMQILRLVNQICNAIALCPGPGGCPRRCGRRLQSDRADQGKDDHPRSSVRTRGLANAYEEAIHTPKIFSKEEI